MDIQFEVDGQILEASELADHVGEPAAAAMRRLTDRLIRQVINVCDLHREAPVVTITLSNAKGMGVRVSGCCQPFLNQVQQQVKDTFVEAIDVSPVSTPGMSLVIGVQGRNKTFAFDLARVTRLAIGRVDPDTGERPDIDLSAYGAYDNGVSRRHAAILLWNRGLFVVDEGSPNGTFLNEERLPPNEPRVLKFGDRIRIGRLVLGVSFDNPHRV
jgi:hypothetical protein